MDLIEQLRREWPVIKQAPLLFTISLVVLTAAIASVTYFLFKANLERKNDLIKTLQDQLASVLARGPMPVNSAQKPEFKMSISAANIFIPDSPDVQKRLTGIALNADIWNTGSASVATDWTLYVIPQGHRPVAAQLTKIPDQLRLGGDFNSTVIRASDSLEEKVAKTPISVVPQSGTLLFYVSLPKTTVMLPSTVLELSVKDIYGRESVVRKRIGDWLTR